MKTKNNDNMSLYQPLRSTSRARHGAWLAQSPRKRGKNHLTIVGKLANLSGWSITPTGLKINTPVPPMLTRWGLAVPPGSLVALSLIVRVPVIAPTEGGVKVTLMVQLAPG